MQGKRAAAELLREAEALWEHRPQGRLLGLWALHAEVRADGLQTAPVEPLEPLVRKALAELVATR